jgi:sulfate transport system permease protein
MTARRGLRFAALGYLALLLIVPVGLVVYRTFQPGIGEVWNSITTPAAISAFWLTLEIAAISVVLNTVLGVLTALLLVRGRFRGKWAMEALLDLPFAVSPVVVGLSLVLVYGRGGWLADLPFQVIFALPGMVLATVFVSLPWQTFWRITLPAIRWGVAYGVILSTARAIGEFGAVSVVSGKVAGETVTMTLLVENRFQNFDLAGAYAASALLALIALSTLLAMTLLRPRRDDA